MISCPYTPQQNGIAKRKHRHVIETAVTLLTEANLPTQFWYHACTHAAFLINRMPSRNLSMQSPYQVVFGLEPEIQHLKVFGTAVYPFLRPYNENKLQKRSIQCVFLGYMMGYKGVACYNISTGKLIISRHVVHDEEVFPYKGKVITEMQNSVKSTQHNPHNPSAPIVIHMPFPNDNGYAGHVMEVQNETANTSVQASDSPEVSGANLQSSSHRDGSHSLDQHLSSHRDGSHSPDQHDSSPHHHSGISTSIFPMLPIHHNSQLEVILPISPLTSSSSEYLLDAIPENVVQTRLRTGAIERKNYAALVSFCPQLQSLQVTDEDPFV
ncbi:hypothetical protein ACFX12_023547 [Malus domestica]